MYIGVTTYPDFLKTQNVQTATAGQTVFTGLNYDPANVEIYQNGYRLLPSQYSAPNGSTLTLYTPSVLGDKIDVVSREENAVGSDVVSVNGKTGVVVIDHFDLPDMPWLDGSGRIPASLLPTSVVGAVVYQGTWNATSGSAPSASPTKGQYWVVSVQGTTSLSGINQWYVGDTAIYNGTAWDRLDGSANEVLSVNGHTGNVVLSAGDITSSLGFTPVQQGGGINQSTNKVYVGWSTEGLRVTVDSTDVGMFVIATSPEHPTGPGLINYGRDAHTLLLDNNQGMVSVGTAHALYGAQYLRFRAEPSLWGAPYGEMIIGSSGENYISGNTNLAGGAFTITPTAGDNSTKVATTAFVQTALAAYDPSDYVRKDGDTMSDTLTILGNGLGTPQTASQFMTQVIDAGDWANAANALGGPNGPVASNNLSALYQTPSIELHTSAFAIPTDATITGVTVNITNYVTGGSVDVFLIASMVIPSATSNQYYQQQFIAAPGGIITFGGVNSTWGYNLSPSSVNGPQGIGIRIYAETYDWEVGVATVALDSVQVTVHYTELGTTSGTLMLGNTGEAKLVYDGTRYVMPNKDLYVNGAKALAVAGGILNGPLSVSAGNVIGTNAVGTRYVSTSAPFGGIDGDIWYQY